MRFINGINIKGGEMSVKSTESPIYNKNYRTLTDAEIDTLHAALQPTGYRVLVSLEAFAGTTPNHADYRRRWLGVLTKLASLRVDGCPPEILVEPHGGSSDNFGAWQGRQLAPTAEASGDEIEYSRALCSVIRECEAAIGHEGFEVANPILVRYGTGNEPPQAPRDWVTVLSRIYAQMRLGNIPPERIVVSLGAWSSAMLFPSTQMLYAEHFPGSILQVHSYADSDRSGRSPVPASLQVLHEDITGVATACAKEQARREWLVGEVAVSPTDSRSAQVFLAGLLAMHAARPLCRGWYWWGYGASPWYDSVLGSVTPANISGLPKWLVNAFRACVEPAVPADAWAHTASALLEMSADMLTRV